MAKMASFSSPATTLNRSSSFIFHKNSTPPLLTKPHFALKLFPKFTDSQKVHRNVGHRKNPFVLQCTKFSTASETESEYETEEDYNSAEEYAEGKEWAENGRMPPPVKRRQRYRKQCPGEKEGITEEMRFVAMKLRNSGKSETESEGEEKEDDGNGETWQPSMEGFLRYLVDTKLVFTTVERIVDESTDVSYVYFRKTGLERSDCISRDLEWLKEQGNAIPETSNPGVTYAQYLEELADKSPPLFLCHLYNIYFSHIAGGQVIARKVSKMLLEGRELEMYKWEGDAQELLRGVREKLNALGEHWSRDEKNRCLREATKAFRFLGQIVRLIIL